MSDSMVMNNTLGLYQKEGISAAVLRVVDMNTQYPVRFDPDGGRSGMLDILESIQDGKLFLYRRRAKMCHSKTSKLTPKFREGYVLMESRWNIMR